jgi:hypothetical protein
MIMGEEGGEGQAALYILGVVRKVRIYSGAILNVTEVSK